MSQAATTTWEEFMEGVWRQNPVFVMVLGLCPTLAVTVSAVNALSMGLATTFVLTCSCLLVSLLRKLIPKEVRIATYIVIIATFVTVVDYLIQAISLALYDALGAFIQLIVVNCIILGRAEAHASKHPPLTAVVNALGMGVGFSIGLFALGSVREILGAGKLFGFSLFGEHFQPWVVMVLPPGGFFVLGLWLLLFAAWGRWRQRRQGAAKGVTQHA
ncbi:MAG: electron transport complex subunit E [Rhodocyclaceae bacterium]|jgi:electron transport complex protein RnfE|nr:electron transport complex subunit E [Rhodocyclaceae bacterium]